MTWVSPHPPRQEDVERAVAALRCGELVGLPTETVYGLAGDGLSEEAVRRIFRVKGRPPGHPVILHLGELDWLDRFAAVVPFQARLLAQAFWPGPLTLILPRSSLVSDVVTGGLCTVALRMPAHPVALHVIRALGRPLAAPSANRFGRVSPTRARHVAADLGSDVAVVLDGGACSVGVESTIVDLSQDVPRLLRPGSIGIEDMKRLTGVTVLADDGSGPAAPGTLPSHYAPRAPVFLVADSDLEAELRAFGAQKKVGVIARRSLPGLADNVTVCEVSGSLEVFARGLYEGLRSLDEAGCEVILTVPPEASGLGVAIIDRLRRAAAPR